MAYTVTERGLRKRQPKPQQPNRPNPLPDQDFTHFSPGLQIVSRPINTLVPDARNARTHSDKQIAMIAGSIQTFGFNNPILIDAEGNVIAGHGRLSGGVRT